MFHKCSQTCIQYRAYLHTAPSDRMHLGLYTPWSLQSPLGCQRPSGCYPHVQCYCSIPKALFWLLHLELSSSGTVTSAPQPSSSPVLEETILFVTDSTTDLGRERL